MNHLKRLRDRFGYFDNYIEPLPKRRVSLEATLFVIWVFVITYITLKVIHVI
jgi:hypothetical protein